MKINFQHILTLFAAYLVILVWNGYSYGHGDMIELLPYAKWLIDSDLYSKDFFLQNISSNSINERFVLAYFFSWFGKEGMEVVSLLLHVVCGMFLLEGLFRIGKIFLRSEGMIWGAILLPLTIFFGSNLGGNEIYIPLITSSTVAKTIGIWAIYFFLKPNSRTDTQPTLEENSKLDSKNQWLTFLLLSFATLIQPLVGLQLFLLLFGVKILKSIISKKIEIRSFLPVLFYCCTGGIWVFILQKHFASGEIENRLLFDFLEFRLSHHFMPFYFSKKAAILLLPMFVWSLFYFYKKNIEVFLFFVIALLGCLIYLVGVEFLEISMIVSAQWFKTTIWLKAFSFIALFAFLENRFSIFTKKNTQQFSIWGIRILGMVSILILLNPISIFKNREYNFSFLQKKSTNPEIEIAEIAKAKTPKDAQFIIPISNTHFKNYSERSTYIDYKAVIHRKAIIPIWYERIQEIYGVNLETKKSGKEVFSVANENYSNLTMEDLNRFSQKGIQYILTFKEVDLPLERVGENGEFVIYKLLMHFSQ